MNRILLIGRVTKDIELRTTSTGKYTCKFNIAVDRPRSSDGTKSADFPSIVAWNQTAELCTKYLHKGDRIGIEGRIQTGSYEKNGVKVYTTDVLAERVEFLTPRASVEQDANTAAAPEQGGNFTEVDDDDLPF